MTETPTFLEVKNNRADYNCQFEILVAYIYNYCVRAGDFVIDGGANAGLHAVPLSILVQPHGRIVCFEPVPQTADALRENLRSAIDAGVAEVRQLALGDRRGDVRFTYDTKQSALSRITSKLDLKSPDEQEIRVILSTIDDEIPSAMASFIKLDLEGYDFNAIRGAEKLINRSRPIIVFENSRAWAALRYEYTAGEFFEFFQKIGYEVFDLHNQKLSLENWRSEDVAFEFLAIHKSDPRMSMVHRLIHHFWSTLDRRALMTDWRTCVLTCRNPLVYVD